MDSKEVLGHGGSGYVCKGSLKSDGRAVAVKFVECRSRETLELQLQEVQVEIFIHSPSPPEHLSSQCPASLPQPVPLPPPPRSRNNRRSGRRRRIAAEQRQWQSSSNNGKLVEQRQQHYKKPQKRQIYSSDRGSTATHDFQHHNP